MRLTRLVALILLFLAPIAGLSAQIPTRRNAQQQATSTGPRLLVGNPHSFSPQDSAPSVLIGDALRVRMDKLVGGQFRVLTRAEMNEALTQFGYPKDAILGQLPIRSLAQALNSRVLLASSMTKDANGRISVTTRMAGLNDDAGTVVSLTQAAGQTLADLGTKIAEGFLPSVKAWPDSKACMDQVTTAPEKAAVAGRKALAVMPKHGLANVCLGTLALARGRKADSAEAIGFFQTAVQGDPLSLPAWTQLAAGYEVAGDTGRTIDALRQMVVIAPTNQPLRELAFKKFLAYGHPETAEQIADDGLKLDPSNTDMWDLLANARIFRENYSGALDALEQLATVDSSRADSTYFIKYLVTASQKPDTVRLVRYASLAVRKYPDNATILRQAAGGYSQVGLSDSLMPLLDRLLAVDTAGAVALALGEGKNRHDLKQFKEMMPFVDFVVAHGDSTAREGAGGLLLNATLAYLQPPQDYPSAAAGFRRVVGLVSPQGRYAPIANHFLGFSLVNLIAPLDSDAEKQKSCDLARQVDTLTTEADAALTNAAGYTAQADIRDRLKQYLAGLRPRTASMIRVYCK